MEPTPRQEQRKSPGVVFDPTITGRAIEAAQIAFNPTTARPCPSW
jgi:hypothetical protein